MEVREEQDQIEVRICAVNESHGQPLMCVQHCRPRLDGGRHGILFGTHWNGSGSTSPPTWGSTAAITSGAKTSRASRCSCEYLTTWRAAR